MNQTPQRRKKGQTRWPCGGVISETFGISEIIAFADDLFHLCYLPGGKRFDTSLTVKAIILDYGMSTTIGCLAKISGREVEQLLRMFGEQSVAVRARFLEIVFFLGNKILPRESLSTASAFGRARWNHRAMSVAEDLDVEPSYRSLLFSLWLSRHLVF